MILTEQLSSKILGSTFGQCMHCVSNRMFPDKDFPCPKRYDFFLTIDNLHVCIVI